MEWHTRTPVRAGGGLGTARKPHTVKSADRPSSNAPTGLAVHNKKQCYDCGPKQVKTHPQTRQKSPAPSIAPAVLGRSLWAVTPSMTPTPQDRKRPHPLHTTPAPSTPVPSARRPPALMIPTLGPGSCTKGAPGATSIQCHPKCATSGAT